MLWPMVILLIGTHKNGFETWNFNKNSLDSIKLKKGHEWTTFKSTYDKQYYTDEEEIRRKLIFHENVENINEHNERFIRGEETFEMGVNDFADLTTEEFVEKYLMDSSEYENVTESESEDELYQKGIKWFSKEVQWYTPSVPVKNQRKCGSCWAFATTGLLEYAFYYRHKEVLSLSEQQLVDCVKNYGCKGGSSYQALKYIKRNGIEKRTKYHKYVAKREKCEFNKKFALKFIKNFGRVAKNEKAIYKQLKRGPLKISIFAKAKAFKHYKSGFISSKDCSRKKRTNHAVVLLGAIKEEGNPLWYIRNSWGPQWGDKGHVKLLMNDNTCNICFKNSVYVTVK